AVALRPDEGAIASASEDGSIVLWRRLGAGFAFEKARVLDEPTESVLRRPGARHSVAFSADGRWLASASHGHRVCVWNAETGVRAARPLVGHGDVVLALAFVPDTSLLVSSSWDGSIRIWDLSAIDRDREIESAILGGRLGPIYSLAVSADGGLLASAGW